jgi:prepilin-type processing-associated H-X9-DG protein
MLLPALNKAKNKAKEIACANNFKQMGIQFFTYRSDNNGYGPGEGVLGNIGYNYIPLLAGYTATEYMKVCKKDMSGPYLCPSAPLLSGGPYNNLTSYAFSTGSRGVGGAFWYNTVDTRCYPAKNIEPNTVTMIEAKMQSLSWNNLASCFPTYHWPEYTNNYKSYLETADEMKSTTYANHSNSANFLFSDGHVKRYKAGTQFTNSGTSKWEVP